MVQRVHAANNDNEHINVRKHTNTCKHTHANIHKDKHMQAYQRSVSVIGDDLFHLAQRVHAAHNGTKHCVLVVKVGRWLQCDKAARKKTHLVEVIRQNS